jgi:hypothetical protein
MMERLNYLTTTKSDIAYYVGVLRWFMAKPLDSHWNAAKGVLLYQRHLIIVLSILIHSMLS